MSAPIRRTVGVVARFESPEKLVHAVKQTRAAGYRHFDVHTPYPIHGMDEYMKLPPSKLGWVASLAALGGGSTAIGLTWWGSTFSYPIIVSGKEFFSYQAFVPIIFELSILGAAFGTVFGMLAFNCLPKPYHPIFNTRLSEKAGDDGLLLSIESRDPMFDEQKALGFFSELKAAEVEVIWEEE